MAIEHAHNVDKCIALNVIRRS